MMRTLFIVLTASFWLAVLGFWAVGQRSPVSAPVADQAVMPTEKRHPLSEVEKHARSNDCWMAINGDVYDFSAYLPQHPTAPAVILPWCGKEATQAYLTKTKGRPHSSYADQLLPNYRIGRLVDSP